MAQTFTTASDITRHFWSSLPQRNSPSAAVYNIFRQAAGSIGLARDNEMSNVTSNLF